MVYISVSVYGEKCLGDIFTLPVAVSLWTTVSATFQRHKSCDEDLKWEALCIHEAVMDEKRVIKDEKLPVIQMFFSS